MLTRERKDHIIGVLARDGRVVAKALAEALGLSEDTIRRDLRELAAEGVLQRVHGGALPISPALADMAGRAALSPEGKRAIGRAAAAMVRPGQVVFLDGGTTALELARHLAADLAVTVVTHSPTVAVALAERPGIAVELIGGRLYRHSMVAVGATAAEQIGRIRADVYFMGVAGIHADLGLTTGDAEEAAIKRTLLRQAAETVVLASREKLGAASPFVVADLGAADTILVEPGLPATLVAPLLARGAAIVAA
jgi:DeoR/GlpR family transcriptional regulator of sugar metabolism